METFNEMIRRRLDSYDAALSTLTRMAYNHERESPDKLESIIDNIGKVRDRFGCTIDEALAIIKFSQENGN